MSYKYRPNRIGDKPEANRTLDAVRRVIEAQEEADRAKPLVELRHSPLFSEYRDHKNDVAGTAHYLPEVARTLENQRKRAQHVLDSMLEGTRLAPKGLFFMPSETAHSDPEGALKDDFLHLRTHTKHPLSPKEMHAFAGFLSEAFGCDVRAHASTEDMSHHSFHIKGLTMAQLAAPNQVQAAIHQRTAAHMLGGISRKIG